MIKMFETEYEVPYETGQQGWDSGHLKCWVNKQCEKDYCDDPQCCHGMCMLVRGGNDYFELPEQYARENCFPKCCKILNHMRKCDFNCEDDVGDNNIILVCSCGWQSNVYDDGSYYGQGESKSVYYMHMLYKTAWDHVRYDHNRRPDDL